MSDENTDENINLLSGHHTSVPLNDSEETQNCSVCLEPIENIRSAKTTLCEHTFHRECIDTWLERHNTCPECRHELFNANQLPIPPGRDSEGYLCICRHRYLCYFPLTVRNCMSTVHGVLAIWMSWMLFNSVYSHKSPIDVYFVLTILLEVSLLISNIVLFIMLRWNIQMRDLRFRRIQRQELPI